jgi:MFS family permease
VVARTPFYYGWLIVAVAIFGNMVSAGSLFWAVTVYIPAIADEFDTDRTPVVIAFMGGQVVFALLGPFVGRYIDGHGARGVLALGAVTGPLTLLLTARSDSTTELLLGWIAVSAARTLLMPIPFNWVMTRWFEGRSRQGALGVVTAGFGFGGAVMLPILAAVESAADWRWALNASALAIFLAYALAAIVVVANRPGEVGLRAAGATGAIGDEPLSETGFSVRQATRTPTFWLLTFGLMLFFLGQGAVATLAVDFFDSNAVAGGAGLLAASALIRAVIRVPVGVAMARLTRVHLLAVLVTASQALAVAVLVVSTSTGAVVAWVVFWGLGGAFAPMLEPLLITKSFGVRHFGAISGMVAMISFGGQVVGPIGGAALFDATGSYDWPFALYGLGFAVAGALFALLSLAVRSDAYRRASVSAGMG